MRVVNIERLSDVAAQADPGTDAGMGAGRMSGTGNIRGVGKPEGSMGSSLKSVATEEDRAVFPFAAAVIPAGADCIVLRQGLLQILDLW